MKYITEDNLQVADAEVFNIIQDELKDKHIIFEMIVSENFTSPAVMQAMGSVLQINMLRVIHTKDIMVVVSKLTKLSN